MRKLFPGYYPPSDEEFAALWKECTFVIDANVLLNLYRYPKQARDELLKVLARVADRIWVPFHAALEFQRNRPIVIAEQKKRFREVKEVVSGASSNLQSELERLQLRKRHSVINPEKLTNTVSASVEEFLQELNTLEEGQINVNEQDKLRTQVDKLVDGRVGAAPKGQKEIDEMCKEADRLAAMQIPPSFRDQGKEGFFSYGGIIYPRRTGDFILWQQVIRFASEKKVRFLVLLTDDDKDDWWWIIESQGKKKLGPRPELVEEFRRRSGGESFHMYSSEQFLAHARKHLEAEVSDASIEQVRDVALASRQNNLFVERARAIEAAVAEWVQQEYSDSLISQERTGFPDISVACPDGTRVGFEVMSLRSGSVAPMMAFRLRDRHTEHTMISTNADSIR